MFFYLLAGAIIVYVCLRQQLNKPVNPEIYNKYEDLFNDVENGETPR
jgi:hypothetical protein